MKHIYLQLNRWMQAWMISAVISLLSAGVARATDPIFQNYSALYYNVPGNPPPTFDVTAFDNENVFSISYNVYTPYPELFQTFNTLNFTNNGTMIANTPTSTNGFFTAFGAGYYFDLHTTNVIPDAWAATFDNAGDIRVNSTNDGNGIFNIGGFTFFFLTGASVCIVNATNIYNPGTLDSGPGGLIQLNAQNADLTFGTLSVESPLTGDNGASSSGAVGTDAAGDWQPGFDLLPTEALSSLPFQIFLTNSTPYFRVDGAGTSNVLVRAVFIQDSSPGVNYSVYIGNNVIGNGSATIAWAGPYQDPATASVFTNYLYLNDDYLLGASTNVIVINGLPDNFTYAQSQTPFTFPEAPTSAGFVMNFLPFGVQLNNPYSYVQTTFVTAITNATATNPSGALTNLTGRVQISATNDLNLANVQITGQNYMSITAPHQFDGSPGANIISPYSDINVGVTNGMLAITNLLAANVPDWNGSVTAWSTRYTNTINGINYDWRALIVMSSLNPLSKSWVQNLRLHGTNSVVIHDVLNVYKSMYIDAQNLTIATNGVGNGATSLGGQLNWYNSATLNTVQLPNLLWLTNNSSMFALNNAIFGSASLPYGAVVNHGVITDGGTTIWATNFVNGGFFTNGSGAFALQAVSATMTNGDLTAGADISITANTLFITNELVVAGRMLQFTVTNLLTDTSSTTNGNIFIVGTAGISGSDGGFNLPIKPALGDLLGTTVTNIAPANKNIQNLWAGSDRGYSNSGYSNNVAIGHMVYDGFGSGNQYGRYTFNAAGASNAIYVDELELRDSATNLDNNGNVLALTAFNNVNIYYAQAIINGTSVAEKLNHKNNDHLRWVPSYAGIFSSTNLVYPPGVTNVVNAALRLSPDIDSDGDGTVNLSDSTPFFEPGQINFSLTQTNLPPKAFRLQWDSIPGSTNSVLYTTNLLSLNWLALTNFISPTNVPPLTGWPLTNTVFDVASPVQQKFYRILVSPNSVDLYGP